MILPIASTRDEGTTRPRGLILRQKLQERPDDTTAQQDPQRNTRTPFDVNRVDGQLCEVSISHDTDWATAVAIVPTVSDWEIGRRTEKG
jgi:holo-[acyl-carrier protein] synthase